MSSCPANSLDIAANIMPGMVMLAILTCMCILLTTALGFVLAKRWYQTSQSHVFVRDLFVYPIKGCGGIRVASADVTPRGLARDRMLMIVRELDGAFQTQRQLPRMATIRPFWNEGGDLVLTAPESPDFVVSMADTGDRMHRRAARVWKHVVPDAVDCGDEAASWISAALATPDLRLVRMPRDHKRPAGDDTDGGHVVSFADGYPLLLVSEASRESVRKLADLPSLAMERFRPNVVVDGVNLEAFEENQWAETVVGDVLFKVATPCKRCQVPRIDPATGTPNSLPNTQPTTALQSLSKNHFGVNLLPIVPAISNLRTVRMGDRVRLSRKGV